MEARANRWKSLPPLDRKRNLLKRPRLVNFLTRHLHSRLQLVCAPAGSGKTSLLSSFADDAPAMVCQHTLEPEDRQPATFLKRLAERIGSGHPQQSPWWASVEQALSNSEASVGEAVEWAGKAYLKADGPMLVVCSGCLPPCQR